MPKDKYMKNKKMGMMGTKGGMVKTSSYYNFPVFNRSGMAAQYMGERSMAVGNIRGMNMYAGYPSPSTNFAMYTNGMGSKVAMQSNKNGRWMTGMLKSTRT